MKTISTTLILLLFNLLLLSQDKQREFVEALINGDENLENFIDKKELTKSNRLGIRYDSVKYKFMISYDIDEKVREEIHNNKLKYDLEFRNLKYNFSMITLDVPSLSYSKTFYFKYGKLISPSTYFTNDWTTQESKYFIFKISEPKYFNDYCVNKLDKFVDSICTLLVIDKSGRELLEEVKIYYILCKDENEIEKVCGFKTRGIYITAYDEVITTYNTHYHELAHLLMNFKLKNLSLYTLPFFQEGFAVAVGGRGGMSARVVTDIGYYLQMSGMLTYDSIISNEGFYKEDASMTYPVAGLYNSFLLDELGSKRYLELYKKVNGDLGLLKSIKKEDLNLPGTVQIEEFLKEYIKYPVFLIDQNDTNEVNLYLPDKTIINFPPGNFKKANSYYKFTVRSPFIFSPDDKYDAEVNYESKKYKEIISKDRIKYNMYKYGILADSQSIGLYNFYTNELIASYNVSFSTEHKLVPVLMGKFAFLISHDVFENDLDGDVAIKYNQ